ncbi:hypothetical protein [Porphyromonas macacae]|uniref:hypothetical protein n=1 Tax=Porphyromonas macacae TaxID=28115 RepID=UPI0024AD0090|nr:hypothetical protein [Porphyromonas macacae]
MNTSLALAGFFFFFFGDFAAEKDFQNRISTFFVILFSKLPFIEKEKRSRVVFENANR